MSRKLIFEKCKKFPKHYYITDCDECFNFNSVIAYMITKEEWMRLHCPYYLEHIVDEEQ